MSSSNSFEYTKKHKQTFLLMIVIGLVAVLAGLITGQINMERFWANLLLNSVYFLGIAVLATFFITVHQIAMAGWHINVLRVAEAMSQFTKYGAIFILVIVLGTAFDYHHLYHWSDDFIKQEYVTPTELKAYEIEHIHHEMKEHTEEHSLHLQNAEVVLASTASGEQEEVVNADGKILNPFYDKIIAGKKAYLNDGFFILRTVIYLVLWSFIGFNLRKFSKAQDKDGDIKWYNKTRSWSAVFLVIWAVSSSMMAWDWVMSLDPHWFSTLFGWYLFISMFVASLCVMTLILVYLKNKGYMVQLNENHLHDLGKYIFGFSIFWTYLWFSQFMLIWYSNIPEETAWFLEMKREYGLLFLPNMFVNFLVPLLVLMRRDSKRNLAVLVVVSSILVIFHWIDFYLMIMPFTVGADWGIGYFEIGMVLVFTGMFLYVTFSELAKVSLMPTKHPMFRESVDHHQ
ncbi:MAG: hypothetical protein KBF51_10490 [Chitinophagales bacterium]|nr:hypothetical protein [Chitinophagales bacterium]MBP9189959.1 hypothetical protein [Chitinophagales bacterium]MBP9547914.1 hypothetical protein [Chitinophagales bacterium]MBP9704866.1 hypothetical protein [Chitinophagales bacterium]